MILMGIMMLTGWMNGITGYLSSFGGAAGRQTVSSSASQEPQASSSMENESGSSSTQASSEAAPLPPAKDFTFYDQYGQEHTLSEYKGKVVFLNFWATWCPPCQNEMPDIKSFTRITAKIRRIWWCWG